MEGYIITKGTGAKKYTVYRCATSDMEVNEGEQFVESLEGWSPFIPPPPPMTLDQKRLILMSQFAALPELTRRAFKQTALDVEGFLRLNDVNNAIFFLEEAKLQPNADTDLIQNMINFLGDN